MAQQKYASLATEDLRETSGLFDDVDATIVNVQYTKEAPDNYAAEGNPIFANVSLLLAGDGPEEERKVAQSYSLGAKAGDEFTVSDDGYGLISTDATITSARKGSKWTTFTQGLQNSGVPKTVLQTGDVSKLIGISGHFKRIADAARNFGDDQRTRPGQKSKFPPSTLVLVKLIAMPGEKTAAKTTSAAPAATTSATTAPAAAAGTGDVDSDTMPFLLAAIDGAKNKTLQRGQITLAVSKAAMGNANRAVYAKRAAEESYLTTLADAGMIQYAPTEKGQPVSAAA